MKKKILSALLVGAMVSSLLAGCGGSDSASTSDNSTSAGSSDAQTTEQGSSDATAEASGIEGKTVAIHSKINRKCILRSCKRRSTGICRKMGNHC